MLSKQLSVVGFLWLRQCILIIGVTNVSALSSKPESGRVSNAVIYLIYIHYGFIT